MFRTVTTIFEKIERHAERSGFCFKCSEKRKRQKTFYQTVNPWNKNDDGSVRTRTEIYNDIGREIAEWKAGPFICASCENNA